MEKENISVANLPNMFTFDKPWDVIKEHPEEAWKIIKQLHEENETLKVKIDSYDKVVTNLLSAIEKTLKK